GVGPPRGQTLQGSRWVVVDVESTGLDIHRDHLLAIGAIGVTGSALAPSDSLEAVLKQGVASSSENILVHHITGSEQRGGQPPAEALDAFLDFANPERTAGCVGYHAAFDEAMLKRACKQHGLRMPTALAFLDLADLAPALVPGVLPAKAPLDDWLAYFGIRIDQRHHAVSDALGTAQLFLALRAIALASNVTTSAGLFEWAASQRWLNRGG
ncbi:MAG: 3'-5' exonuclease, partial [Betaproteobacteria bacterium]|nr:3'-5' exonuclease [Betaproteobacteria bacterium]